MAIARKEIFISTFLFVRRCLRCRCRQILRNRFKSALKRCPSSPALCLVVTLYVVGVVFVAVFLSLRLSQRHEKYSMDTVDAFVETATKNGVPFFMYKTTLLGSWRHHGFIPGDHGKVSFAIPEEAKVPLLAALSGLQPAFEVVFDAPDPTTWKFRAAATTAWFSFGAPPKPAPHVSVSFVVVNGTHVKDSNVSFERAGFVFRKESVFSLTARPFEGRQLPAPSDARSVLATTYNVDQCEVGPCYDEWHLISQTPCVPMPCHEVRGDFYFVRRMMRGDGACEELVFLNWVHVNTAVVYYPNKSC